MKKNSEVVKRVKALRNSLGMNQLEFAQHGGFPQSRVSEWESGKAPSADMYIRLGKLALYPDNLWFWEQAGIDRQGIADVAGKILGDRLAPLGEGQTIEIPAFLDGNVASDARAVAVLSERVPHPLSTFHIKVEGTAGLGTWLEAGDIIVFDARDSFGSFTNYDGQVIVAKVKVDAETYHREDIVIGRLLVSAVLGIVALDDAANAAPSKEWTAQLLPVGTMGLRSPYLLGSCTIDPSAGQQERREAVSKMSLRREWKVLGRLVEYIPSQWNFLNLSPGSEAAVVK